MPPRTQTRKPSPPVVVIAGDATLDRHLVLDPGPAASDGPPEYAHGAHPVTHRGAAALTAELVRAILRAAAPSAHAHGPLHDLTSVGTPAPEAEGRLPATPTGRHPAPGRRRTRRSTRARDPRVRAAMCRGGR